MDRDGENCRRFAMAVIPPLIASLRVALPLAQERAQPDHGTDGGVQVTLDAARDGVGGIGEEFRDRGGVTP